MPVALPSGNFAGLLSQSLSSCRFTSPNLSLIPLLSFPCSIREKVFNWNPWPSLFFFLAHGRFLFPSLFSEPELEKGLYPRCLAIRLWFIAKSGAVFLTSSLFLCTRPFYASESRRVFFESSQRQAFWLILNPCFFCSPFFCCA